MNEDRIRIAFLGGSHSHASDKVDVVRENRTYELVGLWDSNPEVASRYVQRGVRLLDRAEILDDDSIDVIAVESDVPNHAQDAIDSLRAGKHVHVEKPPADNLAAFHEIQQLARRQRLHVQVGYMWRYNPAINAALQAGRSGWLGDIYLVRAMMNALPTPAVRKDWARFRGGDMFEQGSHLVDVVVRLMGKPNMFTPFLRRQGSFDDELLDNTLAVFEWPSTLGVISAATLQPNFLHHRFFEILGTNGTAVVRPIEPPSLAIDLAKPAGPYQAGLNQVSMPEFPRFVADFEELAACILTGQPLAVSAEEDLAVQETLLSVSGMLDVVHGQRQHV